MVNEWTDVRVWSYAGGHGLRRLGVRLRRLLLNLAPSLAGVLDRSVANVSPGKVSEPLTIDAWYDPSIDQAVRDLASETHFDAVMVVYVYLSKVLENFGDDVVKIIDTHDVFSNRHKGFGEQGKNPVFFYTSPEEEAKGLDRADLVIAIQRDDAHTLSELSKAEIITIGHMPNICTGELCAYTECPDRILYVATDTVPNQDAMDFFIDEVWPLVKSANPKVQVDIVGGICHYLKGRVDTHFRLYKQVEKLEPFYRQNCIVINPVRIGTGLKIKNVEALFMGKPLVTTAVGAQGLGTWGDEIFLVANDSVSFAEHIRRLLSDAVLCRRLSENAEEFSRVYRGDHERGIHTLVSRLSTQGTRSA